VAGPTDPTPSDALEIRPVAGEAAIVDWQRVHNAIIPVDPLSLDEVRERVGRNRLTVAYHGDVVVGCATVRPPTEPGGTATVIARVLPAWRQRGFGTRLYADALAHARGLGARGADARGLKAAVIETIVWAGNPAGLHFAEARGFVEVERYTLDGAQIPYVTLRLTGGATA
jgi:GNAT superfamily N-acetyltransferase